MKGRLFAVLILLSLFCVRSSLAANLLTTALFESNLDPTQEVPPSTISAHSGTAKLQFDLKTKYLAWIVDHTVWDSTGAQLHGPAAPGATAPVLIDLGNPTSPINGGTTLNADQEKSLMEGLLYFNILSPTFPNGDIRGQIIRSKSSYTSTLEGKAMTPPITSNATGTAQLTYDHTKRTLTFTVTHNVTAPSGVFLHGPAQPEQIANSTFKFPRTQSPIQGTFTFNTSDEAMLFEDLLYINITSQTHPYGELRGQVIYLEEGDEDFSSGWTWWKVVLVLFGITSGVVLIGGSAYYGHRYWKKRKEYKEQTKQLADPLLQ